MPAELLFHGNKFNNLKAAIENLKAVYIQKQKIKTNDYQNQPTMAVYALS